MTMIGNNLRLVRKQKGLTLQQLEKLTGIRFQILSRFEKGLESPTKENLEKIEKVLEISLTKHSAIDEEIIDLYESFLNSVFMGETCFSSFIEHIQKNQESYRTSVKYYMTHLMLYVIRVIYNEFSQAKSMEKKLEKMIQFDQEVNCLYWEYKGVKYYKLHEYDSAKQCYDNASGLCIDERFDALITYHLYFIYKTKNKLMEAKQAVEKAKSIFLKHGAYKRVYSCDMCLADIYSRNTHYKEAIDQYRACLNTAKMLNYADSYKAKLHRNISWNYIKS